MTEKVCIILPRVESECGCRGRGRNLTHPSSFDHFVEWRKIFECNLGYFCKRFLMNSLSIYNRVGHRQWKKRMLALTVERQCKMSSSKKLTCKKNEVKVKSDNYWREVRSRTASRSIPDQIFCFNSVNFNIFNILGWQMKTRSLFSLLLLWTNRYNILTIVKIYP